MNIKKLFTLLFLGSNFILFTSIVRSIRRNFIVEPTVDIDFPVLSIPFMANHSTSLNDIHLNLSEFEFQRLQDVAMFIMEVKEEKKPLLDRLQYFAFHDSLVLGHNAYSAKRKHNYYIGFSRALRESPEYSIAELNAITAHELGHLVSNHLETTATLIHILNDASSLSLFTILSGTAEILELITAAYLRNLEREANLEALRMYSNPCAHISLIQKIEKNNQEIPLTELEQSIENFLVSLRKLYPIPEDYTSTHPSRGEAISFFRQHITEEDCEAPTQEITQCKGV